MAKPVDESLAPGGPADLAEAQRLIAARGGDAILTTRLLASLLGKRVPTIRDWRTRRVGPRYIRRGSVMYKWADVQEWLAGGSVTPGAVA